MLLKETDGLFAEYKEANRRALTKEQFDSMVMFFPSLLVVASDGVVDEEELIYVNYLGKFMADSLKDELTSEQRDLLEEQYVKELGFLLDHLSEWEPKFVAALKAYLAQHAEAKEDLVDILYLFAEASDGLSEEEEEKIEELKQILDLQDVEL